MKKNKIQLLKPIDVGQIIPVKKKHDHDKLSGFLLSVTYDGVARNNTSRLSKMGLLSGGYGFSWTTISVENNKTVVDYFFREGALFPEPFAHANKFRNNVLEIINGFNPVRVSGIETQYALSLFDELYVSGYCVTVGYSDALLKNPYFIKYLPYAKSTIKDISCMDKMVNVKYLFSNKRNENVACVWQNADDFRKNMLARIKHENIK